MTRDEHPRERATRPRPTPEDEVCAGDETTDVLVIGAGFGGLGAALALAEAGRRVVVCESLNYPGGCASTFRRFGCSFEAGATLSAGLGEGELFDRWRSALGLPFEVVRHTEVQLRLPSLVVTAGGSREAMVEQLAAMAGAGAMAGRVRAFFRWQAEVADVMWTALGAPELLPPWRVRDLPALLRLVPGGLRVAWDLRRTLLEVLDRFGLAQFRPLVEYCDAVCQITVQTSAARAEAPIALATLDYFFRGAAHVRGGIGELARSLQLGLERLGGRVELTNRVRGLAREGSEWRIETRRGVRRARQVVANLQPEALARVAQDAEVTARLAEGRWAESTSRVRGGWGARMMYLVVDDHEGLPGEAHHIQAATGGPFVEGRHVFVSVSARDESARAPAGQRTVTVSTHVPAAVVLEPDAARMAAANDEIAARMAEVMASRVPEVWEHKRLVLPASPRTFERFVGRPGGFVGGPPRTVGWHNYASMWPTEVSPGLVLVGDTVFPGQSTLAAALGGVRAARVLLDA